MTLGSAVRTRTARWFRRDSEEDAFLAGIEAHKDQFYRFVRRNVWDSSLADDVFASAVLAAYENRHRFEPGTNFRAWMFRILANKCFQANRETARAPESLDDAAPDGAPVEPGPGYGDILADPDKFLEQCGDEVYQAFRSLSTAQRTSILLKDLERFSYREIADILDIPVATVMTHLARGRARLRKELYDYACREGIVRHYPRLVDRRHAPERQANGSEAHP